MILSSCSSCDIIKIWCYGGYQAGREARGALATCVIGPCDLDFLPQGRRPDTRLEISLDM